MMDTKAVMSAITISSELYFLAKHMDAQKEKKKKINQSSLAMLCD